MQHNVKLYTGHNYIFPLWLTKQLILYMGGEKYVNMINWTRSTRYYLILKKACYSNIISSLRFFYPDGCVFRVFTENEINTNF
ncbi:ORF68 [Agrotis segetum granulovirus]|uniref:Lef-6 n=1 Tax=Agrotis segetum granulosis virus TaxID=10464 RepID=Q6QXQ1_GVAS|nr:lef-6 [Agrotis segetum granulovirus]AAS82670.1 ORF68 [Agrotis segetum granulovirus]AHN92121.1 lef-6 [Agrotis segetum granulovirus]AKN63356.1 lef-6 [Agrotis segetum granulovirus]